MQDVKDVKMQPVESHRDLSTLVHEVKRTVRRGLEEMRGQPSIIKMHETHPHDERHQHLPRHDEDEDDDGGYSDDSDDEQHARFKKGKQSKPHK